MPHAVAMPGPIVAAHGLDPEAVGFEQATGVVAPLDFGVRIVGRQNLPQRIVGERLGLRPDLVRGVRCLLGPGDVGGAAGVRDAGERASGEPVQPIVRHREDVPAPRRVGHDVTRGVVRPPLLVPVGRDLTQAPTGEVVGPFRANRADAGDVGSRPAQQAVRLPGRIIVLPHEHRLGRGCAERRTDHYL